MRPLAVLATLVAMIPAAASAQSLGMTFIETTASADSAGAPAIRLTGDWAITGAHGLQFDIGLADTGHGALGQIDAHLYMAPREGRKYGLFASLADVDGREATVAMTGVEGMIAPGPGTVLNGAAALGYARPGSYDFIAVRASARHAVSDNLSLFVTAQITEVDEARLRALPWQVRAGATWEPDRLPIAVSASIVSDGLSGRDSAASETRAELSLTWRFGAEQGPRRPVAARSFDSWQPFDPLLRRGLF